MGNTESIQDSSTEHTALKLAFTYQMTIKMNSNYHRQAETRGEHCLLQSFVSLTHSFVWTVHFLHGQSSPLHHHPQHSQIHNLLAYAERETGKTRHHSEYQMTTVVLVSHLALSELYHRLT